MIGREGHDLWRMGQRNLVVPMKEVGAESGDGAPMVERHRPESPHMVAVRQLLFIHEPEGARKGFREGNASSGEMLNQALIRLERFWTDQILYRL